LRDAASGLDEELSDFRDHLVAHSQSPRARFGLSLDYETRATGLYPTRLFWRAGKDPATQEPGPAVPDLMAKLDAYLLDVVRYLQDNEDKRPQ
jgi:hypothetical protein